MARALALLLLLVLVVPTVASLPASPEQGRCTQTLETRVGQARLRAYTEETGAGSWRTWLVAREDVAVPPPPGALSPQALEERAELHRMMLARTPEQEAIARRWDDGPATYAWERIALGLVVEHGAEDATLNPPRVSRMLAILETSFFDALVLAWDAKYCHQRSAPGELDPTIRPTLPPRDAPSYPSEHAVAAGVAATVLREFFPQESTRLERLAREAAESRLWAGANHRSDVEAGLDLGREVAARVLAARADDGHDAAWDGVLPEGTCLWQPTLPYFAGPLEPQWGRVRPWALPAPDAVRPPPPPACDGSDYLAQSRALYDASFNLTPEQEAIALRWAGGPGTLTPPGMALEEALEASRARNLSTMRHARAMSHVAAAVADAAIAAWDAKFHYWGDRPIHTIHRLWDPAWQPLVDTPPFPGYVSGHSTFAGAAAAVLTHLFPDGAETFAASADESAISRFYGGIHIDADNEVGLLVGHSVGAHVAQREATVG